MIGGLLCPDEPIQPIDPAAWVSHSAALTGTFPAYPGSSSMSTITSGSSLPDGESPVYPHGRLAGQPSVGVGPTPYFPLSSLSGCEGRGLSIHMDMASVTKAMAAPESGLEVRDRMWLKITIPNAFLGTTEPGQVAWEREEATKAGRGEGGIWKENQRLFSTDIRLGCGRLALSSCGGLS